MGYDVRQPCIDSVAVVALGANSRGNGNTVPC